MRKTIMKLIITTFLLSNILIAQSTRDISGNINVKDFGAKGDGKTDDTKAIQAAFDTVKKYNMGGKFYGLYYNVYPEVIFPAGKYIVSDTIKIAGSVIRGFGDAAIIQKKKEKDIFFSPRAWRMTIMGLTFLGGKNQLNLGNNNIDTGFIVVEKCKFYYSNGIAILTRKQTRSTDLVIKDCIFAYCEQVLVSHTDHTIFRDSWISTGHHMKNKAAIENRGWHMVIENILGVPIVNGVDQRWIDNYGRLTCRSIRFGGEGGGFTAVVNYAKYTKECGGSWVIIEDSYINSLGNHNKKCAIYLEEIPNQVVIRNCVLAGMPAVKISDKLNLKTYFDGAKPGMIHFDISKNVGEFTNSLPKELIESAKKREIKTTIKGQLSISATRKALAQAVLEVKKFKEQNSSTGKFGTHIQKTNPTDYIELTPLNSIWDLNDYMDGTATRNSEYIAIATVNNDIILLRRAEGKWPHILIRNVKIDLDKTPYLTWKLKNTNNNTPAGFAVRVIHKKSGVALLLTEVFQKEHFYKYYAYNLKKLFGLTGGKHTFDIKFYVLACQTNQLNNEQNKIWTTAKPGEYLVLDFIRIEKE